MSSTQEMSLLAKSLQAQFPESAEDDLIAMVAGDWVPEKDREALRVYTRAMIDEVHQMIETLGHQDDEIELYNTLAFYWVELKCEWNRYNQLMNYQLFQKGQADTMVLARGSLGSTLLGRFETLLAPTDLVNLTEVAARPLEVGQPDVGQLSRFLERYSRAKRVLGKVVDIADAAGAPTSSVKPEVSEVATIDLNEIWPAVVARIEEGVKTDRQFTISGEFGFEKPVDTDWVEPMVESLTAWVQQVCEVEVTQTPEERVSSGLTGHIMFTVRWGDDADKPVVVGSYTGGSGEARIDFPVPTVA